MTEEQARKIISLLEDIKNSNSDISSNTNSTHDLSDIHRKLKDIELKLNGVIEALSNLQ